MEKRIYEALGVKQWKKFLLWMATHYQRVVCSITGKDLSSTARGGVYLLSQVSVSGAKDFRKMIWMHTVVHTAGIISGLVLAIIFIVMHLHIWLLPVIVYVVFNIYCVMLQRYNYLRIRRVLSMYDCKVQRERWDENA